MSTPEIVSPALPGRLGDPAMSLRDDPRADPRLVAAMAPLGMDVHPEPSPVTSDSSMEEMLPFWEQAEMGFELLGGMASANTPAVSGVVHETVTIDGLDNNQVTLYIHRPDNAAGPLPAIVHTHGGGMGILRAANDGYVRWRDELAATGLVVVGVEFRNSAGALGPHPFPAGLNDCVAAARWVFANRQDQGVSHVVMSGESGGGNLSIATTLRANREGWVNEIAGVYAQCPYISNLYHEGPAELASLTENDGYMLDMANMSALARCYSPDGSNDTNPLAWPYHCEVEDLAGLPPHVVSVNELDPLRDEGLAYYRKLLAAGVDSVGRTVLGTTHAADCLFLDAIPDIYRATVADISHFAHSVG